MSDRVLHCWKGRADDIEERHGYLSVEHLATFDQEFRDGTCLLPRGHAGPHKFTPDDEIVVKFSDEEAP